MADVVILGAGLNGLTCALLLARDGHDVTVLERDAHDVPASGDVWADWERRGVTQFRQPHMMMPRWYATMELELADVLDDLRRSGGRPFNLLDSLRAAGPRRPGDDRFDTIAARRPLIEAALVAAAARTPRLQIRRGVSVTGLVATNDGPIPHVRGVRVSDGPTEREVPAHLVVDAGGRRSALLDRLRAIGASRAVEEVEDCGFVYYARHYRSNDGSMPAHRAEMLQHYPSVSILTAPGDDAGPDGTTWSVVIVTSARDTALRALRDAATWEAAIARFPMAAHWAQGEPITGVDVIAGIEDRHRRLVIDGEPVVTGLVAVGDAWACTNPSVGRGASIGVLHVRALRDVLRDHDPACNGDDAAHKLVRRFAELTDQIVEPWYRSTVAGDRHRLAEIDADVMGEPYEPDDPTWSIATAMASAARVDADVARGLASIAGVLATPDEVLAEPGLFQRIIDVGAGQPRYGLQGPTRSDLLAAIAR